MSKLSFVFDFFLNREIKEYLFTIPGVIDVNIHHRTLMIEYDNQKLSDYILCMEVFLFLDIFKRPSLISFDKHANKELLSYCMKITDICCEYCLKGMLDELFLTNGVISVFMEYDDIVETDKCDAVINITYDPSIINEKMLTILESKFNTK